MAKKKKTSPNQIAYNRQARHNYEILETFEAGLSLRGSEVKSLREGHVSFKDGYVDVRGGEAWLKGVHIAPYENAAGPEGFGGHDPERPRRLLLHSHEIDELEAKVSQKGLTVIPLKFYFARGKIKLEIGLGRGLKHHDQRQQLKDRAIKREMERDLR
ncbi:SsrA-binding protein SmpB [Oceanidesulfovibrio marinus]|uniref:SsrA-binding protein n=1 Tax=Oceanidesulfovibrio marinus TaxID=370038 RepID=A0A6P1ZKS2_9BACT|nr:SsrA-binding protein SmpB [Oceanidesulfovibrio marinus]QJT09198.1 SsrA-binding protein SmpB [Oceanidesulfovibrio marinus]TVM36372.1 SsrA-binding protein [Oceanidesulfovibrio marinus]